MPPSITLRRATVVRFVDNSGSLPPDGGGLDYLFGFGFGFHEETRTVAVRASILAVPMHATQDEHGDVTAAENEPVSPEDAAAEAELECVFALGSLEEFRTDAGEIKLHRQLLAHLMGITVSTVRGVFLGAGRSPLFQQAPLPIGAPIRIIDQFVDAETHPWIEETPAMPPAEEA